jgi:transposase-like protein
LFRDRVRDIGAGSATQTSTGFVEEAARSGTSAAEVARRYGIAGRLLRRWKQELAATAPTFVTVQITDAAAQSGAAPTAEGAVS